MVISFVTVLCDLLMYDADVEYLLTLVIGIVPFAPVVTAPSLVDFPIFDVVAVLEVVIPILPRVVPLVVTDRVGNIGPVMFDVSAAVDIVSAITLSVVVNP